MGFCYNVFQKKCMLIVSYANFHSKKIYVYAKCIKKTYNNVKTVDLVIWKEKMAFWWITMKYVVYMIIWKTMTNVNPVLLYIRLYVYYVLKSFRHSRFTVISVTSIHKVNVTQRLLLLKWQNPSQNSDWFVYCITQCY